jgi:hypothetical protein
MKVKGPGLGAVAAVVALIAPAILLGACGSNARQKPPNTLGTVDSTTTTTNTDISTSVVITTNFFSDGTAPTTTVTTTKPITTVTNKPSTTVTTGADCGGGFVRSPGAPGGCIPITHGGGIADCGPGFENPPGDSGTCVPKTTTTADPSGTDPEITRHQTQWKQGRAANYRFEYFEENMVGGCRFVITVAGDAVTSAQSTGRNPECFHWADKNRPPTIDAVFAEIASSPGDVKVSYGDVGIPGRAAVDPIKNAIDDEYAFGAENYVALTP